MVTIIGCTRRTLSFNQNQVRFYKYIIAALAAFMPQTYYLLVGKKGRFKIKKIGKKMSLYTYINI